MEYELVPLHNNRHHFDDCTAILNEEWPRSQGAREHSLNKSCDDLPCCLVYRRADSKDVAGFSQVVAVQGKDKACLLESVIIRQDLRGTGLGRKLMEATEHFIVKRLQLKTAYLNTIDKQGFYSHLGYTQCGPVVSLGANAGRVSQQFLEKLLGTEAPTSSSQSDSSTLSSQPDTPTLSSQSDIKSPSINQNNNATMQPIVPPPPSVAPPPPPPPPQQARNSSGALSRHVIRMDPNAVTWMKKSLQ